MEIEDRKGGNRPACTIIKPEVNLMTGGDGSKTKFFAGSEQKRDMNTHIRQRRAKARDKM